MEACAQRLHYRCLQLTLHFSYQKKLFGCDVTPPQVESKLDKIVAHLLEAEKDVGSQDMKVPGASSHIQNDPI